MSTTTRMGNGLAVSLKDLAMFADMARQENT